MPETDGITIDVPITKIVINGIDKQRVSQFAAEVRGETSAWNPTKGQGIRYAGEYVAHKESKAGKGVK